MSVFHLWTPPERKRFMGWSDTWVGCGRLSGFLMQLMSCEPVWEFADRIQITQ
jgi:hypothetical protein